MYIFCSRQKFLKMYDKVLKMLHLYDLKSTKSFVLDAKIKDKSKAKTTWVLNTVTIWCETVIISI